MDQLDDRFGAEVPRPELSAELPRKPAPIAKETVEHQALAEAAVEVVLGGEADTTKHLEAVDVLAFPAVAAGCV